MRSHAKASSAGPNQRQATRRGRFAAPLAVVLGCFLVSLCAIACIAPAARAAVAHEYQSSFGPDCTESTHFEHPGAVAVDPETHDVYVADQGEGSREVFRCTANGEEAEFSAGPGAGTNAIPGFGFSYGQGGSQIAVSPVSHDFYVADKENFAVKAYAQNGEEALFAQGEAAGTNQIFGFFPCGVAVDAAGDIYVAEAIGGSTFTGAIKVLASSGEEITSFETVRPCNLAVDSTGELYVNHEPTQSTGSVEKFTPSSFPVSPSTTYAGTFFDGGPAYSIALDPSNDDLYVDRRSEAEHSLIAQRDEAGNLLGTFANPGEPGELVDSEGLAIDGSSGAVYVSDADGETSVRIFVPAPADPPTVGASSVSGVTASSANVAAQVNPHHFDTHYRFQYLTLAAYEANGETFSGATETEETDLGSAGTPQSANAHLGGLQADTTYVFRVLAENENNAGNPAFGNVVLGEEGEFHTHAAFPAGLPDGRAYEMVSPAAKGGEVFIPDPFGELGGSCEVGGVQSSECYPGTVTSQPTPMQGAPDGEAVVYEGSPFFAGLSSGANEYLAKRGPGGWATQGLSGPQFLNLNSGQGYMGFSPDLSRGVIYQVPALSPEAPTAGGKSFANIYLRLPDGSIEPLVSEAPPHRSPGGFCDIDCNELQLVFDGGNAGTASSPGFSHLVFEANDALTGEVAGIAPPAPEVGVFEKDLYEWQGGQLHLINVLPGNNAAPPGAVIGSGRLLTSRQRETYDFDHAISDDGSRVFWSESSGQVYVRIDGEETQKIEDPGKFLIASADGSKLLLNDGCLYDLQAEACEADLGQGHGAAGFEGILGAAEDLSRVYFVDTKALTPPSEENANGKHAVEGENNLYAWHEGVATFIGALLFDDNETLFGKYGDWKPSSADRLAQVSSDGTHLAFMSKAPLTGYDNRFRGGGECPRGENREACFEVFEYDAGSGQLACASCNPTGLRPLGHSNLSLILNEGNAGAVSSSTASPLPQPNNLSTDGQGRLFFESQDTLSPRDTNGRTTDVYEWEPNGVGSCHRAEGCVFLITSGHALDDSFFVDSTPSGKDAFFIGREQLTLADKNEQLDLFDARIDGGLAAEGETTRSECQGEACQPAGLIPEDKTPSSSAFKGAGNVKAKQHKKKHKKQHKRHAKKRHHKRAANANRGGVK